MKPEKPTSTESVMLVSRTPSTSGSKATP
uniref:Uncharacterized protein n=1 Tax=Lotus japonicus TaxID=34305 RepID=I3SXE9_LOTJA|nr:unknown [Lotus japonicus]